MEERCYAYWLANISGVGCRTIHQLRKYCGSARELYGMGAKALLGIYGIGEGTAARICESKKQWDLEGAWEMLGSKGISFVSMEEDGYPKRLREIYDPPYALYFIGGLPREEIKTVGIVGMLPLPRENALRHAARRSSAAWPGASTATGTGARCRAAEKPTGCWDAGSTWFIRRSMPRSIKALRQTAA